MFYHVLSVNDTLDDILDESGDEEEQDAIVTQVLDEIGIEISGKVSFFMKSSIRFGDFLSKVKNSNRFQCPSL